MTDRVWRRRLAIGGAQLACCALPQAQHFTRVCNHYAVCLAWQCVAIVLASPTARRRRHTLSVSFHNPAVGHRNGETPSQHPICFIPQPSGCAGFSDGETPSPHPIYFIPQTSGCVGFSDGETPSPHHIYFIPQTRGCVGFSDGETPSPHPIGFIPPHGGCAGFSTAKTPLILSISNRRGCRLAGSWRSLVHGR